MISRSFRTKVHLMVSIRAAYKGFADTIRLLLFRDASQERQDKEGILHIHFCIWTAVIWWSLVFQFLLVSFPVWSSSWYRRRNLHSQILSSESFVVVMAIFCTFSVWHVHKKGDEKLSHLFLIVSLVIIYSVLLFRAFPMCILCAFFFLYLFLYNMRKFPFASLFQHYGFKDVT